MKLSLRPLLLALLASTLGAQVASAAPRHLPARVLSPIMAVLDTDRDGTLSATEIAMAPVRLAALDLNGDGLISPDERRALNAEGRPVPARYETAASNILLILDANQDGELQWLEIANAVSSLKQLDRNGDGVITPDELRPALIVRSPAAVPARGPASSSTASAQS